MTLFTSTYLKGAAVLLVAVLAMCNGASAQIANCPNIHGGDCFEVTPGIPGCTDGECCELVCIIDPACCENNPGWDELCVSSAFEECVAECTGCGILSCSDCFVDLPGTANPFANDLCDGIECLGCCSTICAVDAYCCNTDWDGICVGEAIDLCGCAPEDAPANDDCVNAIDISEGTFAFSTLCSTSDGPAYPGTPCDAKAGSVPGVGPDVWYRYTASADQTVRIHTCDTIDYDTELAVFDSGDCPANIATLIACSDDGAGCLATGSEVIFQAVQGNSYLIDLGGLYANTGEGTLVVEAIPDIKACNEGVGSCVDAHAGPGCSDFDCCFLVCFVDPNCCNVEWDQTCVDAAVNECAIMPCELDLSSATYTEIEVCGADTNGGCNSVPPVYETISSGDIVAGSSWADGAVRDTDWYLLSNSLADFDTNGNGTVDIHNNIRAELPVASFIIIDTAGDCVDLPIPGTIGAAQSCGQIGIGVTNVNITDIIYVWVGTADANGGVINTGYPCPPPGPAAFGANYLLCATITDDGEAIDTGCPPVSNPCPWDLDGSGAVGTGDLLALFAQWGQVGTSADFDGGGVSTSDLLILFANWGPCP